MTAQYELQHPRVRFACCNAIGQMSTDFAPIFEKKFHDRVIPGLLHLMDDHANPRVQAHAGAALVNFSEDCPKSVLAPYLDNIMTKLESILTSKFQELQQHGNKLVLEQIVTTIASVADAAEEKFTSYYERLGGKELATQLESFNITRKYSNLDLCQR